MQYFVRRVVKGQEVENNDDCLFEMVKTNYPKAFTCANKIKKYLKNNQRYKTSESELIYLTIHIQKITVI